MVKMAIDLSFQLHTWKIQTAPLACKLDRPLHLPSPRPVPLRGFLSWTSVVLPCGAWLSDRILLIEELLLD